MSTKTQMAAKAAKRLQHEEDCVVEMLEQNEDDKDARAEKKILKARKKFHNAITDLQEIVQSNSDIDDVPFVKSVTKRINKIISKVEDEGAW